MRSKKRQKSWADKRDEPKVHAVVKLEKAMLGLPAGTRLLIPTPLMVDSYVRKSKPGQFVTPLELRQLMAHDHGADHSCPLVTGIHLRIVAEAALDEIRAGADPSQTAPFWRVIHPGTPLAKKLNNGLEILTQLQTEEGILPRKA